MERNWISPPSKLVSSRLMASPSPVPPYLRLVPASACWKASKMIRRFSKGIPMPVSATSKATTAAAPLRIGWSSLQPPTAAEMLRRTPPCSVNGTGELDLFGCQIAIGVLTELLAQDQDAVKRRAQLVRHVGQELGFVLGGQGQLCGLLFQRPAGLFDLLVLAFHLDVLLGELLGFLRELVVGLLQLLLLRL